MRQNIVKISSLRTLFIGVAIVGYLLLSFACSTALQTKRGGVAVKDTVKGEQTRSAIASGDSVNSAASVDSVVAMPLPLPIVVDTTLQPMELDTIDSVAIDSTVLDSVAIDSVELDSTRGVSVKSDTIASPDTVQANLISAPAVAAAAISADAVAKVQPVSIKSSPTPKQSNDEDDGPLLIDYRADMQINYGDKITRMIGNVKFHHNGAIIECDSAYMYPDDRMEFFSNVLIEKDSAYVYGDRVLYDGNTNLADVYAPIVKTVQGDATMYSYNLQFNTATSVGVFEGGGVMSQKGNIMEAQRGYFDANADYVKFLDSVAMSNDKYVIKTDSLGFNFDVERVDFLTTTLIWDSERDFLMADGGHYFSPTSTYLFTSNAYVMTPDNELWADTMRYVTELKQAYMFDNVQILDTANAALGFGDWAFYDDSIGRAILTLNPSVRVWDDADTSYMRGDTIMMLTFEPGMSKVDFEGNFDIEDAFGNELNSSEVTAGDTTVLSDSLTMLQSDSLTMLQSDSLSMLQSDSLSMPQSDTLSSPLVGDSLAQRVVDSLGVPIVERGDSVELDSVQKVVVEPVKEVSKREAKVEERKRKLREKREKRRQRVKLSRKKIVAEADSISFIDPRSFGDSLQMGLLDSTLMVVDSAALVADSLVALDSAAMAIDTVGKVLQKERVVRAYHDVRIWSVEYQAKCDSTVSFSVDSTVVMYGDPVLWSESNQITADMIELFTKNEELDWADFTGDPFVAQQVLLNDTTMFNQAAGKRLEAYFTNNELDYIFMSGNVENIYYMDEEGEVVAMVVIECADLTMNFEEREPTRMIWSGSGSGPIYPIEKVPEEQSKYLAGFIWHSSLRPKSAFEICRRALRPSIREEVSQYSQPLFVISILMDQAKERHLESGAWRDRSDVPTVTPQYFIDSQREFLY